MILALPVLDFIPKRIVSLVPSQTELLYHLGLENETVGITKFCVYPPEWFSTKSRIGGTKTINIDKVKALKPDLIIGNKEENDKAQVEKLAKEFPVWVTDVTNLDAALQMILDIGKLTSKDAEAQALVVKIEEEFSILADEIRVQNNILNGAYLIWKDPYMTVGADTFINDMLEYAGIKNIFSAEERYPTITLSDLRGRSCDLLLLSSEPFPFNDKHIRELNSLLPGVKIMLADGEMFSWYGSRLLHAPAYFRRLKRAVRSENAE